MLPPTIVCKLAPIVPKIERERTTMPRTSPRVSNDAVAVQGECSGYQVMSHALDYRASGAALSAD